MPLGLKVGLDPSDIVLDGDPAPASQKVTEPPTFGRCLLWPNGWMNQDATWYGGRPQPSNVAMIEAYRSTKWHLDPSSHLATTDMG